MKAIVLGASGLIGTELIRLLSDDPEVEFIRIVTRRPLNVDLPKLEEWVIDLDSTEQMEGVVENGDRVFSCIGTTQRQVKGDRDAYREIDHAITLRAGHACLKKGAACFSFVSSGGANAKSSNFYLRLKGEIEEDIAAFGLPSLVILQPSLLLGKRSVFRPGERLAQFFMPRLSFLFPANFRPVRAVAVAEAMIKYAKKAPEGCTIVENQSILAPSD
jgi:uncharacterized protein YbjT (DUF2867 family)